MELFATLLIDAHTHIFPPECISSRDRFFENEPEFRLLYGSTKSRMASAEELIESMDNSGVDRAVVFGFPWRSDRILRRHNDYVLESAKKFQNRLIPLACLDLFSERCMEEVRKRVEEGVFGFGELAVYGVRENMDSALAQFSELAQLCSEKKLVILAHANEPLGHSYPGKAPFGVEFYFSLASRSGGASLILAHWGGGLIFYELLKKGTTEALSNVYYDTAASPFLYRSEIFQVAANVAGAGKIIFGSDYPLISPKRYMSEISDSGLSDLEIKAILGGNAARIFGLKE